MINYQQVRQYHLENRQAPSPSRNAQILVIGFALIIFVGTILLALPIATEEPVSLTWLEALFTATSATTVTGLAVVSTGTTFSLFGEIVILGLIQVGGVGFITLSIVLFRLIGRRVSFYERSLLQQNLGVEEREGIVHLARRVMRITILIELIGAVLLFTQWIQVMDWRQAVYYSLFHSISAFCNAGFDLFNGFDDPLLLATRDNPFIIMVLSLLITIGTLGVAVAYDLVVFPKERHLSLHTRLVLPFTILLTMVGMALVLLDETFIEGHALAALPLGERLWMAFFTVVSARTAGITLLPMADLGHGSQLLVIVWMFIGGAPASMGGGVGLSTMAVVLITLASTVRGYDDVRVWNRTIPTETVIKAIAVVTVSSLLVLFMTFLITLLGRTDVFEVFFEVVSAFSNTGYSLGITDSLGAAARLLIIFTMFWGRLGPLTLIVALAQRHRRTLVRYPEEKIIIG